MAKLLSYLLLTAAAKSLFGPSPAPQQNELPELAAAEPSKAISTPGAIILIEGNHLSPDSIVYFGGLQARDVIFINSSALRVVTPYLRPGTYKIDVKVGELLIHSDVDFEVLPAPVDSEIDGAEKLVAAKHLDAAIELLSKIASNNPDYDVRAFAHYRAGQLYLAQGDYWRGAEEAALIWDKDVSMGVQTSWRYRLLYDETAYSVSISDDHDTDLRIAESTVKMDVTENPEPRFWRALLNARFGNLKQAKTDLRFILIARPDNQSYRALEAYIGVLSGDKTRLEGFRGQKVTDARAIRILGQAAYINGDSDAAQAWWMEHAEDDLVWAKLDYLVGLKHLKYNQVKVGTALLAECATVTPDSSEGKRAKEQLAVLMNPAH
jgi:tetratricopeptide (TPR) repeat protein